MMELLAYLLLGAGAGVLAGLFGVGGGLILVPGLAWIFFRNPELQPHYMHLAVASSLGCIVFSSLSSTLAHHRRGTVRWDLFGQLIPGLLIGGLIGGWMAQLLSTEILRRVFGAFELLIAAQMLSHKEGSDGLVADARVGGPGWLLNAPAGAIVGVLSSLVGIGGGGLIVPYLVACGLPVHRAISTAAACGLPIALAGVTSFAALPLEDPALSPTTLGYLHLPALASIVVASVLLAPIGVRLAHTLSPSGLRQIFALLLAFTGIRMLV